MHAYLMRTAEAAQALGVSESTLRSWRGSGEGPRWIKMGDRPGSAVAYRVADIMAWIESREQGGDDGHR
jgi:predicted DNA-binding transcriptional regulator AlpA